MDDNYKFYPVSLLYALFIDLPRFNNICTFGLEQLPIVWNRQRVIKDLREDVEPPN